MARKKTYKTFTRKIKEEETSVRFFKGGAYAFRVGENADLIVYAPQWGWLTAYTRIVSPTETPDAMEGQIMETRINLDTVGQYQIVR